MQGLPERPPAADKAGDKRRGKMQWLGRLFGVAVSIALLGYFIRFAVQTLDQSGLATLIAPGPLVAMAISAFLGVIVLAMSAWAWRQLLASMSEEISFRAAFAVMAITQLAKYVPGNVAQHLGRAALSLRSGLRASTVGLSLLQETVLLLVAGFVVGFGLAGIGAEGRSIAEVIPFRALSWAAFVLGLVAMLLFILASARPKARKEDLCTAGTVRGPLVRPGGRKALLAATGVYAACYLVLGLGLWLQSKSLGGDVGYLQLTAAFAIAWLAGFLSPGVPAGLGSREGVLLLLLDGMAADEVLLALILASRLASILGDLACFLLGLATRASLKSASLGRGD